MYTHTQARSGGGGGERACVGEGMAGEKVKGGLSPRGVLSLWVCVVHSALTEAWERPLASAGTV